MTSKTFSCHVLLLSLLRLMMIVGAAYLCGASPADAQSKPATSAEGSTQQPATEITGTWSGTFFSKHSNVAPFSMTVVINRDSLGHLVGSSTLNSDCLKGAQLQVTITGAKVVLAGSDEVGNNITVRGTLDKTGTQLKVSYILNGSASARCETDGGTGSLARR